MQQRESVNSCWKLSFLSRSTGKVLDFLWSVAVIHIHTEHTGPRVRYTFSHVFERTLGWTIEFHADRTSLQAANGAKLCYGQESIDETFHVVPAGLLIEGTMQFAPDKTEYQKYPVAFPVQGEMAFDPFSFVFFMLSRMEEYGERDLDEHGRFRSADSWMVRNDCETLPVVDIVINQLGELLRKNWPQLPVAEGRYKELVTFDIDNGLKYAGREWWRSTGSFIRDLLALRLGELNRRLSVLWFGRADPYELTSKMEMGAQNADRVITFFIASERSSNDHAVPLTGPIMRQKMLSIARFSEIGLHPSYRSLDEPNRIALECKRLASVVGSPVKYSRQHFLRFRLPETYRALIAAGINEEHSMGYSDRVGFRAGTSKPFAWYDLDTEQQTSLEVHPFCMMDSALCYKMERTPDESIAIAQSLREVVKSVDGHFTTIWHERFLAGTGAESGWDRFFKVVSVENRR